MEIAHMKVRWFYEMNGENPLEKTMEYLDSLEVPEKIRINGKEIVVLSSFDQLSFGQKVLLDGIEGKGDYWWIKKTLSIVYLYEIIDCKFGEDKLDEAEPYIDDCLIVQAYPVAKHILKWLRETNEREQEQLSEEPDAKQKAAGIDKLSRFGVFGTVDRLAQGKLWMHAEIYKLPYIMVFNKLLFDKENRAFERRYHEILYPKRAKK